MIDPRPARLRRLIALAIDIYGCMIPAFFAIFAAAMPPQALRGFVTFFCAFLAVGYLYGRDWLLGGRSIGKRICGLSVVDCAANGPATGKQLLLLDLCFMILPFDAVVLLLTGRSIGERISGAAVVRSRVSGPIVKRRFWTVAALAAVMSLVLNGVASLGLDRAKENESYALSLNYLIGSETFAAQETLDAKPVLVGFSSTTHGTKHSHHYTFETDSHIYDVTCHPDGDGWSVCTDCTEFD